MKPFIKIGRDNSNDIVINEPRVSRNHAIITNLGDGTFEIRDQGSSNGTFVNGHRVQTQIISPEDRVEVATCLINWHSAFTDIKSNAPNATIHEEPMAKIIKTVSVGTSDECDIVMKDSYVSGRHANISLLKNGNYYIQDLESSNGTFVNGAKITSKNFSRTDVVKIASADLPNNWFLHDQLTRHCFRDHKKAWIISILLVFMVSAGTLSYLNRCKWFNYDCTLTAGQIYEQNNGALVHLIHTYYYKIDHQGKTYFVGRNNLFKVTEANPSKENLLPYSSVTGSGAFISSDGTILTSPSLVNPWLNEQEMQQMIKEVHASRTIPKFTPTQELDVCGETAELLYLANGMVNNPQNYVAATALVSCSFSDRPTYIIQSVKKELPLMCNTVNIFYDSAVDNHLNRTDNYYYSIEGKIQSNSVLQDTLYSIADTFNINKLISFPVNPRLPRLVEGSIVLNGRGELVGIIQDHEIKFLHEYFQQLNLQ